MLPPQELVADSRVGRVNHEIVFMAFGLEGTLDEVIVVGGDN